MNNTPINDAPVLPPASLRLTIDRGALASNWQALDALSGRARAGAAVKADCYGLGVNACVPVLRDAGCATFFVAHWGEVAAVMAHVPAGQIAVLHGVINDAECAYAKATGAVPVINSIEQADRWIASGGGRCHLMVDTGINRLGIAADAANDPKIADLNVDILMSHLASADEDSPLNPSQLTALCGAASQVRHQQISLANSAGIALGADYAFDLTRPGIALYGGVPRSELANAIRPVAHVEAAILQTRMLGPGDSVGYNATFTATAPLRVGTVSIGYADGFLRSRGIGNSFSHEGRNLPILGKVSMDMIVIDLTNAVDLVAGDWVQVPWNVADAARENGLSPYEMLTVIGHRLRGT